MVVSWIRSIIRRFGLVILDLLRSENVEVYGGMCVG